jgi:integrase
LADMKQMFAFALNRDLIARNPLDTVTKRMVGGGDVERERILSAEELQTLVELLPDAGLNKRTEIALWLILATGCRIGELMGATWNNPKADVDTLKATAEAEAVKLGFVNLAARTWHITETKNQRDHTIHLSDFAADKFYQLLTIRGAADWCFPNSLESGPVCVKSFGKQLSDRQRPAERRMKNRTSKTESLILPGGRWTAHDLRRTVASLMAVLGFSGDTIDECLNHKIESRVRRVYVRDRRLQDQARAFDALGARLAEIEGGKVSGGNVIAFKTSLC